MKLSILLFLLFSLFSTVASAKRFKVKNCDSSAMADIDWAVDFVETHMNSMLGQMPFIPTKYTDKIKKKWPNTTIKCSNQNNCKKTTTTGGFHATGNNIKLCWDNIRDSAQTRCELVSIIMHEKGHAAKIPIEKKHNDANSYPYVRGVDLVYRLDAVVSAYCQSVVAGITVVDPSGSRTVETTTSGRLSLGAMCSRGSQCLSGKCTKNTCVCKKDTDCPGNNRCVNRIGKNYCVPQGGLIGDFCKKNKDCSVGKCEKKSCVCKTDNDCTTSFGSSNFRCAKPVGKKNFCQMTSVALGGACQRNSDCAAGKCRKKVCSN